MMVMTRWNQAVAVPDTKLVKAVAEPVSGCTGATWAVTEKAALAEMALAAVVLAEVAQADCTGAM